MRAPRTVVIGTRGSALALWQANAAAAAIDASTEIRIIRTSGDRFLNIALQGRLEKGFFTREIEAELLAGEIDLAVHSLKDLPTESPPGLCESAYLPRAPVNDLLLVREEWHDPEALFPVREGCRVGATSLRRQALLRCFAPQAEPAFLRGNVPTRIRKCREGQYGAIILARAGVERLQAELGELIVYELDEAHWLPAPGQGAVCLQSRCDDEELNGLLAAVNDGETMRAVRIERGLLARFEGGCHTAFGALARPGEGGWKVLVGLEDPERGWVCTEFSGTEEECLAQGPETLGGFAPPALEEGVALCRRIQWSS